MVEIKINNFVIGNKKQFALIAGPCVIENKEHAYYMAKKIKEITTKLNIPFIFKSSFDKANRTAIDSYRGVGLKKGLKILKEIKEDLKIPVTSDVHLPSQVKEASEVLDILQIPAFLCRQTDLLIEAAKTNKIINIKKGQFISPFKVNNIINKIKSQNNNKIIITERGTSFGYNSLVNDMRSLYIMRNLGALICFDATHSVQMPGCGDKTTGGDRTYAHYLSRAAVAVGIDLLFMEVHDNPDKAPSDGPNMIKLENLENLLKILKKIDNIVKNENEDRY